MTYKMGLCAGDALLLGSTSFGMDVGGSANVISFKTLGSNFHVIYDSKKDGGLFVCTTPTPNGKILFSRCPITKFPYLDLDDNKSGVGTILVQNIRGIFERNPKEEIMHTILARQAQARSGHPSEEAFKREMSQNSGSSLFRNCPLPV